jgi:BMFP domain-containing protein YqiC
MVDNCQHATRFIWTAYGTAMINRDTIEQLAQQIGNLFGHNALSQDFQRNLRALIQSGLGKMDVVTRDEFDAQQAVLERTREKLDQLEVQLTELAAQLGNNELH